MTPRALATWLLWALLLLWLPGCSPLSGPSTVTGTVGGSLNVQCRYPKEYRTYNKYWCREPSPPVFCSKIVQTQVSERRRRGRVSIRDHPVNLTFTVTLKDLTLEDAGSYWCGVDTPWYEGWDDHFEVTVTVDPKPTSGTPTSVSVAKTSTTKTQGPTVPSTSLAAESPTQGSSSQEDPQEEHQKDHHKDRERQGPSLLLLLSLLALLLLLLVGASLLAWRMFQKPVKAGEHSELSQNFRQAAEQSEPQYVNLQLHTLSLREEPEPPRQVEVEYSTVAVPREELHYTSVVFDSQKPDSSANGIPSRTPREEEPEYSVIRKPRDGHPSPRL